MSYPPSYGPVPVEVVFPAPTRQNRLTIFFRVLLVIPHFILLVFFGIAVFVAVFLGWFAALVLGRLPIGFDRFIGTYLQYSTRVYAYLYFLTGAWPSFDANTPGYPVHVIRSTQPLNRWAVFFRFFLALPAAILAGVAGSGLGLLSFFAWVCGVVLGRIPAPFHYGFAALVRYQTRYTAYGTLITPTWPFGLFGDRPAPFAAAGWPPAPPMPGTASPMPGTASPMPGTASPMPGTAPPYGAPGPPPAEPPTGPPPSAPRANPWGRYPDAPSTPADPPSPAADPYWTPPPPTEPVPVTRLVLTPGATVVVALALVVGVFGSGANAAFGGGSGRLGTAISSIELTVDYNHVSSAVQSWDSQVATCEANNDLACARRASQSLAGVFGRFGDQIGSLSLPGSASADAASLRRNAYRAQSELQALAGALNGPSFLSAARELSVTTEQFDADYRALVQDLTNQ